MLAMFESVGRAVLKLLEYVGSLLMLLWETFCWVVRGSVRLDLTIQQMAYLGVDSLLIVILTTTTAGMVISLQLAHIAVQYGVTNVVGGGVAIAMARELGPMLTAVVVAGRAGSAIAAELGTMKVTEQISALQAMAVSPVRYLVVPRFLALVAMMPILVLFADVAGTLGGALVAFQSASIPYAAFYDSIQRLLELSDVFNGMLKAVVFGIEVAMVACLQGLTTGRGAAGVGVATTSSVVLATIIIFLTNYLMSSWLFPVT
ncbi:MAG: ABC transporter permease [Burkholderiales bacterium]|jgi:phospholipid/cholesterol/gamma-HCH transport system permease protein|nr:ABC transporter permease [Burkholderiales bacterium]